MNMKKLSAILTLTTTAIFLTACASNPTQSLAIQKADNQYEVTGLGKTQIIAKNNAVVAANKTCAKKATPVKAAKAEIKTALYVQFAGNEVTEADIIDKVKAAYVAEGHKESAIKEINLYVKPEEYAVYYVINDKAIGKVNLF